MDTFLGLRAKMYACNVIGGDVIKKAKGTKQVGVRRRIDIGEYKECLLEQNEKILPQNNIISNKHENATTKIALCASDDKRFICEDKITTLLWGHYAIIDTT